MHDIIIHSGEKALTKDEYDKVLAACKTQEDRVMVLIGVSLGIRRYDMSQLLVRNINFITNTLSYIEKKKGNRVRVVPMPPKLAQELYIYITSQKRGINDRVFTCRDRALVDRWYKLCDDAGIPRRGIHALRGTCVKFCQQAGWTVEQTAKLIGDTVRVVQMHYLTPSDAEIADLQLRRQL